MNNYIPKLLVLIIYMVCYQYQFAQKNDYVWLTGQGSYAHNPLTIDSTAGNAKLDFNYSPVEISFDSIAMFFDKTEVSFSDDDGNLLFYSNGIYISNYLNEHIEYGDSINYGSVTYQNNIEDAGEILSQGILCLPDVSNSNQFFLITSFYDTVPGNSGINYVSKILATLIDTKAQGGLCNVIYKNEPIIDTISGISLRDCLKLQTI